MQPFFITGFQRSGTTLLRVMVDSHPEIAVPLDVTGLWWRLEGELARFGDLLEATNRRALVTAVLGEERIRLWNVPLTVDGVLERWTSPGYPGAIAAFYAAYAAHFGKRHWGDKDPGNMTRLDVLNRWFPECRVLHLVRDGRGACASLVRQNFGPDDLLACAEQWREEVTWVRRMGALLGPARYLELRYEALLAEPERILGDVCRFLGVEYSEQMLRYGSRLGHSVPGEKRHLWPLLDQPPRADNAERWREGMPAAVQICFEKRAGELLRELGYPTSAPPWRGHYGTELRFLAARAARALRQRFGR